MAHKRKPVFAGEVRHLRHQHRIRPSSSQTSQTGVVDNADLGCVAPEPESLVEETLHLEAVEAAIEAQEAAFGVAQVDEAGNQHRGGGAQLDPIGAGVVLHFCPSHIGHAVTALLLATLTQAQLVHAAAQGGVKVE